MKSKSINLLLLLPLLGAVQAASLAAQADASTYDNIWRLADWYASQENPVIQDLHFSGRFQYEYARVDDGDVTYDEWNVRRMRLGVKVEAPPVSKDDARRTSIRAAPLRPPARARTPA